MFSIKYVNDKDKNLWFSMDDHITTEEFRRKVSDKKGYVIFEDETPIGVMRYKLFSENIPLLKHIYINDSYQRRGFGRSAIEHWENEMKNKGFKIAIVSTEANEFIQNFYRKLGYEDCGFHFLDNGPEKQPMEMFLYKVL